MDITQWWETIRLELDENVKLHESSKQARTLTFWHQGRGGGLQTASSSWLTGSTWRLATQPHTQGRRTPIHINTFNREALPSCKSTDPWPRRNNAHEHFTSTTTTKKTTRNFLSSETRRNGAITTSIIGPDKTVRWRRRSSDARGVAARTGRRRAPRHRHSRHTRDHHTVNTRTTLTAEQTLIRNEIKLNFWNYWNRGDSRTTKYDSWLSLNMSLGFYEFHQTNKPLNRFVVIPHIKIRWMKLI